MTSRQPFRGNANASGGSGGGRGVAPPYKRPKPVDFRTWELAKLVPPLNSERFVVLSYNILADYLANSHRNLYFHIPRRFMSWDWRKNNILFELKLWSPDIICFQEVDKFQELEEDLRVRGYIGFWKMRTGEPVDGCAIFFRSTRFRLMFEDSIEFNSHGMRDNVAQICVLESVATNQFDNQASSSSSGGPNRVVVCNIHVLFNPRRGEMKLGQVRMLLEKAKEVSKTWDDAPIVVCGDFNCTPKSPLYNFISEQKLDITQVDRDKVSGQASTEIRPPVRFYSRQSSGQPAGNMFNPGAVALNANIKDRPIYNPSQWTPDEIATATGGNTDCIKLEHPLKLQSTYTEVEGSSGRRDSCGEPVATSYTSSSMGTVDYIWRSEGLQTTKVLAPLPKDVMQPSGGFPTKKWGSDHIALATELAFTR